MNSVFGPQVSKALFPDGSKIESVCAAYGDPRPLLTNGVMQPDAEAKWRRQILSPLAVYFPSPVPLYGAPTGILTNRVYVHRALFEEVMAVMQELKAKDVWKYITSFAGCYAYRKRRGASGKQSMHSWAAALDFNADVYPQGTEPNPNDPFVKEVLPVFKARGWTLGAEFSTPDPMHISCVTRE